MPVLSSVRQHDRIKCFLGITPLERDQPEPKRFNAELDGSGWMWQNVRNVSGRIRLFSRLGVHSGL